MRDTLWLLWRIVASLLTLAIGTLLAADALGGVWLSHQALWWFAVAGVCAMIQALVPRD
jgi:hypothetical protein